MHVFNPLFIITWVMYGFIIECVLTIKFLFLTRTSEILTRRDETIDEDEMG